MDVGAVYDHKALRYDHHQRGFGEVLSECGFETKVATVYRISFCSLALYTTTRKCIPSVVGIGAHLPTLWTRDHPGLCF